MARARAFVGEHADLEWFDRFFGARPGARFTVALGLLNGPLNYASRVRLGRNNKKENLYAVLGVWKTDENGEPVFDRSVLPTLVHEFCHSYVNPIVFQNEAKLAGAGKLMYPWVESEMKRQAYGNWLTVMCESVVRASVVRYVRNHDGARAAEKEAQEQVARHFRWTPQLSELLEEYEADRKRYRDFASFFPRVIGFLWT